MTGKSSFALTSHGLRKVVLHRGETHVSAQTRERELPEREAGMAKYEAYYLTFGMPFRGNPQVPCVLVVVIELYVTYTQTRAICFP